MSTTEPRWRNKKTGMIYDRYQDPWQLWVRVRREHNQKWDEVLKENVEAIDDVEVHSLADLLDAELQPMRDELHAALREETRLQLEHDAGNGDTEALKLLYPGPLTPAEQVLEEHAREEAIVEQSDYDEVTIEDPPEWDGAAHWISETDKTWTPAPEDIVSGAPTPNIQPYLREMSWNVGNAYMQLAEVVNHPGADLYHIQAAYGMLEDEIRRLSDKKG